MERLDRCLPGPNAALPAAFFSFSRAQAALGRVRVLFAMQLSLIFVLCGKVDDD